jgi:hypothetical protein
MMVGRILKIVKWLLLTSGAVVLSIAAFATWYIISDKIAYSRVEITSILLAEARYDPAEHFAFDRACISAAEASLAYELLLSRGYEEVDPIFPESHIHWSLVLIDDKKWTFRTLYGVEPQIHLADHSICAKKMRLTTKIENGIITAYVDATNSE